MAMIDLPLLKGVAAAEVDPDARRDGDRGLDGTRAKYVRGVRTERGVGELDPHRGRQQKKLMPHEPR